MQNLLLEFRPAKVVSRKETYVSYYVVDPTTDNLKRLRVRCNHVKGRRERLKYATALCSEINRKLFSGWNPLTGTEPSEKRCRKLLAAAQEFCSTHSRNLRPDSQRSYRSKLKQFSEWCVRRGVDSWLCSRFTGQLASEFLTQYDNDGKRSAYSYNDMLRFVKSLFTGFISAGLAKTNPFESFKPRKRETKHRTVIPKQDRKRILDYFLRRNMPEYIAPIRLCFRYLIRPKEILMLRIGDIDFDRGLLRVPPEVSKNHDERIIAVGYDVMKYFNTLRHLPTDQYIFSANFKPGGRLYTTKNLFSVWHRMREDLLMPSTYHFYSLKDTGITEMLESGMPSKFVRDLAGHKSLSMTERYMHAADAKKILSSNMVRF